jgi:hypothetical protein
MAFPSPFSLAALISPNLSFSIPWNLLGFVCTVALNARTKLNQTEQDLIPLCLHLLDGAGSSFSVDAVD